MASGSPLCGTPAGEDSLLTASLDGSGERVLASYKRPEYIDPHRVAWSPDGKTLAFVHQSPQPVLTTIAAEGGPAQPVAGAHWATSRISLGSLEAVTWSLQAVRKRGS